MSLLPISVVIPSYRREEVLVETLDRVLAQCRGEDEVIVVDQTPEHEPATEAALHDLAEKGRVHWLRKSRPSICEAMNVGVLVARHPVVLFLDDDVVPAPGLLDVYRELFTQPDPPAVVNGQVLQPWHSGAVESVRSFGIDFDHAYARPAEILSVITGNCAVLRDAYLAAGGMDETFEGGAHRCDADLGYRMHAHTGRPARFEPRASVRHLAAGGGTRSHGAKDAWASIGSAVGDHYFGMRWLGRTGSLGHSLSRLRKAALNRTTLRRPWLVPVIVAREVVAWTRARRLVRRGPARTVRELAQYDDLLTS
ncbi:MAG: glycosyltransferase family 2 protein [Acidobacteriota bacterium]|nr:glycosyltransferase family 2 protein [Acidobacteriota bacterium]